MYIGIHSNGWINEHVRVGRQGIIKRENTLSTVEVLHGLKDLLEVDEGDPFNEILAKKSINEIKSLNFFKNVETEILDVENENTKIINITVEEKPTGEISLAAGVGTGGSTIGGGIVEKNFLGKGVNLKTNLEILLMLV